MSGLHLPQKVLGQLSKVLVRGLPQGVEASFYIDIETELSRLLDLLEVLPMHKRRSACTEFQLQPIRSRVVHAVWHAAKL